MKVTPTELPDVLLIEPKVHGDQRGWFVESFQRERYRDAGIELDFVQDNMSYSARGTLRGLHIQNPHSQGKLVQVIAGEVFDVAVDARRDSPHFGRWTGVHLSADNKHQLWVPPGFLHGFLVLSDTALFSYKCTDLYHPQAELSVRWDDPDIGIRWPLDGGEPSLSDKDRNAPLLRDIPRARLPV
jgi:dTDP-4-dehydrorhamnose 3,5-epimerase